MKWKRIAVSLTGLALILGPIVLAAERPRPELYLTPLEQYSRIGRALAIRFEPQLAAMPMRIVQEIRSDRFELIDVNRSPMGGAGFWINPGVLVPEYRYLGVAARVNVKLVYFPDNNWGRVGDALDAFGKDMLRIAGDSLGEINDNSVRGVVMVIIYSKLELDDPQYWDQAEAAVFFIPRAPLARFNANRMTFQELFDQSDIYIFRGADEINILFTQFLNG
jgi:hypothetical protein